ncbi:unnamed protein product, partial [marine sediment metagenome]
RRMFRGEQWYRAHRLHAFQRLHVLGYSHRQVLLFVIALNSILTALTLFTFYFPQLMFWTLGLALAIVNLAYLFVEAMHPMFPAKDSQRADANLLVRSGSDQVVL